MARELRADVSLGYENHRVAPVAGNQSFFLFSFLASSISVGGGVKLGLADSMWDREVSIGN